MSDPSSLQLNAWDLEDSAMDVFQKIDFPVPSTDRPYCIQAMEPQSSDIALFYVNFDHLTCLAPGLSTILGSDSKEGQIEVPIQEFETFMNIIFHNYHYTKRMQVLDSDMHTVLSFAKRYEAKNLIDECKIYVMKTELSTFPQELAKNWHKAFTTIEEEENTEVLSYLLDQIKKREKRGVFGYGGVKVEWATPAESAAIYDGYPSNTLPQLKDKPE